eukprot:363588-Chlamydomonas_euryale.AAC.11
MGGGSRAHEGRSWGAAAALMRGGSHAQASQNPAKLDTDSGRERREHTVWVLAGFTHRRGGLVWKAHGYLVLEVVFKVRLRAWASKVGVEAGAGGWP